MIKKNQQLSQMPAPTTIHLTKREEEFKLPVVPNFIRRAKDDHSIPYGDLSDFQIRRVARAWREALLQNARRQRENRI